jgi:hypothetical protein
MEPRERKDVIRRKRGFYGMIVWIIDDEVGFWIIQEKILNAFALIL